MFRTDLQMLTALVIFQRVVVGEGDLISINFTPLRMMVNSTSRKSGFVVFPFSTMKPVENTRLPIHLNHSIAKRSGRTIRYSVSLKLIE